MFDGQLIKSSICWSSVLSVIVLGSDNDPALPLSTVICTPLTSHVTIAPLHNLKDEVMKVFFVSL